MNEDVKIGDLFAINIVGRFELYHEWRFHPVAKITPTGKLRFKGIDGIWSMRDSNKEAVRSGRDTWRGPYHAYRVTDENRKSYDEDNLLAKLRLRYHEAIRLLERRPFKADIMTEERVKLLEQFMEETES